MSRTSTALIVSFLLTSGAAAEAATRHVGNDGKDEGTCPSSQPCRTIAFAMSIADPSDTISVGPGIYGNLEGAPGHEDSASCTCIIKVDKALTILSRDGAWATVITGGGAPENVVEITASDVEFGRANQGFTITRGGNGVDGVVIGPGVSKVSVTGNISTLNAGFGFSDHNASRPLNELTYNRALANGGAGFDTNAATIVRDNVASMNGTGFQVGGGFAFVGRVTGNIAVGNTAGFSLSGAHIFLGNAALGNYSTGITIGAGDSGLTLEKSSVFGNDSTGPNCGLLDTGGNHQDINGFFWGASTGPGEDPADEVCEAVPQNVFVNSPATKEVKVAVRPIK